MTVANNNLDRKHHACGCGYEGKLYSGVDGKERCAYCHRKVMASLKDGPGSNAGGSPFAAGSPGYVAK